MRLNIIDTTLREGLQAGGQPIFVNEQAPAEYLTRARNEDVATRFELYMPCRFMSRETWEQAIGDHADILQIYVGPAHDFNINDRPELQSVRPALLSTTLIRKTPSDIDGLGKISTASRGTGLRVGLECAATTSPEETLATAFVVAELDNVIVVNINDSNSCMSTQWIEEFFSSLRARGELRATLGFHLHNGKRRAYDNAKEVIRNAIGVGIEELELDATAFGFGERLGVLACNEALQLKEEVEGEDVSKKGYAHLFRSLFRNIGLRGNDFTSDVASSHYDEDGYLRVEYSQRLT